MAAIGRKDRQSLQEVDNHVKEFRQQFTDQIKCLDFRLENKVALVMDVQEFMRKRSEMEMEYSKNLERLADRFTDKFHKQRSTYGLTKKERAAPVNLWSKLLKDTKYKAKAAATMSDILSKNVATRFTDLHDDVSRISAKVKDTHAMLQDEIMKFVIELQQAMKIYYTRQSEFVFAKAKLKESESAKAKAEKEGSNKKANDKRIKNLGKRQQRYNDSLIKATKARNDYVLALQATQAALNKYYDHDISDIVSKSDHNYHNSFKCAFQAYCQSELYFASSVTSAADTLSRAIGLVDPDNDRFNFLEDNQQVFCPDRKVSYVKYSDDTITTITSVGALKIDLEKKQGDLYEKLQQMKSELAELGDVMIARNNELNDLYRKYDSEMNAQHSIDLLHPANPLRSQPHTHPISPQTKVSKEEGEMGFLNKFKELILSQNLNISKQAKYDVLTIALGEISQEQLKKQRLSLKDELGYLPNSPSSKEKRPIKLFGTTLEHQYKQTNRDIPELVDSCIRFISKFGLEHQGIFRVSGTSQEISDMKKSFEEGKDPLAGLNHWKDINAVAGVFRAYFRELQEPLFPSKFCDDYIRISRLHGTDEQIQESRKIFSQVPSLNLHIIKYLFKFLNLVSTKSDKNRMTSHNLAVVFGPTVIHAPATIELITNQGQINIFIERLISEFYSVFPNEKLLNEDGLQSIRSDEVDEENDEVADDDADVSDVSDEENDGDFLEAEALYDYCARSHKELSFKKGDIIQVFARANKDWWDARIDGSFGFVPANYVKVASPENERLDVSSDDASVGATEVQSKAESSSEEPFLLEEKVLSPRSDDGSCRSESPRTSSFGEQKETKGNFFDSIDPTVSKTAFTSKSATIGSKSTILSAPQPFQNKGGSLPRGQLKSDSDSFLTTTDSLSSTVFAVREAFGGQRVLKPAAKGMAISADDLKSTQSKLRPGTPEDAQSPSEQPAFEERPIPYERGGSVKNITQMFSSQASGPVQRKPLSSTASDEGLVSPLGDESKRFGSGEDREKERESRPPAPAVKPKPIIRRDSSSVNANQTGPSELIATIKAAAAAKVVKEIGIGVKEETNL